MLCQTNSFAIAGISAQPILVEIAMTNGLPTWQLIGLPSRSVLEAKDRLRAAFKHLKLPLPTKKITINLTPAHLPKHGTHFDLAIAIGLLAGAELIPSTKLHSFAFLGELGLDGSIKKVRGLIPMLLAAQQRGITNLVIPAENWPEACNLDKKIKLLPVSNLTEILAVFQGSGAWPAQPARRMMPARLQTAPDLNSIAGLETAKQALVTALAGGHHLLFISKPGSGKTNLIACVPGLLPHLSAAQALEVASLHSLKDKIMLPDNSPPLRSPHHTISLSNFLGGGKPFLPGELSLAHHGVLCLDELPAFHKNIKLALLQPLETGYINIPQLDPPQLPCQIQLLATANPCLCVAQPTQKSMCRCTPQQLRQHWQKIPAALLDRFDISFAVNENPVAKLSGKEATSVEYRNAILQARKLQHGRYGKQNKLNSQVSLKDLLDYGQFSNSVLNTVEAITQKLQLSFRAKLKIMRVARTIADLDNSTIVQTSHITAATSMRLATPLN